MRKHFVLDTNILLHDPEAIYGFADNSVWVPIVVIEEIDQFKKDGSELGRNAREVARKIDALAKQGSLTQGVALPNGGQFFVMISERKLPDGFYFEKKADDRILAVAAEVREQHPNEPVILVSLDTNLRIRAGVLGLEAEDYDPRRFNVEDLYPEVRSFELESDAFGALLESRQAPFELIQEHAIHAYDNEYVTIKDAQGRSVLARLLPSEHLIEATVASNRTLSGLKPRNREQTFALDACLRPDIHVVTLIGKAGTGKTLMALAAGLHMITEEERYKRLLVSRPVIPMGKDLGFLPGDVDSKLKPWMQPIHDNLEFLLGQGQRGSKKGAKGAEDLMRAGVLEVEPLTYIRGRSISSHYLVVDEAQNLTPHEIKTILTRAGEGTKVIFTGDPFQIDNPYVDSLSNGLTYLVDRFRGVRLAASVTLRKGERSALAEQASTLL